MELIAMGFSAELSREAVVRSPPDSLEHAVEYCFNNPQSRPASGEASSNQQASGSSNTESQQQTTMGATTQATESTQNIPTSQTSEAMSISSTPPPPAPLPLAESATDRSGYQLDKTILDKFAQNMLPGLMKILDNVPDTVYRVCDLIVCVVRKYGDEWRDQCLAHVLDNTCDLIKQVCQLYCQQHDETATDPNNNQNIIGSLVNLDQRLASRLLLFCLLFEEMQLPCVRIVNSSNLLDKLVSMLQMVTCNRQIR